MSSFEQLSPELKEVHLKSVKSLDKITTKLLNTYSTDQINDVLNKLTEGKKLSLEITKPLFEAKIKMVMKCLML